jgi:hypothetical protein
VNDKGIMNKYIIDNLYTYRSLYVPGIALLFFVNSYNQNLKPSPLSAETFKNIEYEKQVKTGSAVLKSLGHGLLGLSAYGLGYKSLSKSAALAQAIKSIDPLLLKAYTSQLATRIILGRSVQLGGLVWASIQPLYFAYKQYQINKEYAPQ